MVVRDDVPDVLQRDQQPGDVVRRGPVEDALGRGQRRVAVEVDDEQPALLVAEHLAHVEVAVRRDEPCRRVGEREVHRRRDLAEPVREREPGAGPHPQRGPGLVEAPGPPVGRAGHQLDRGDGRHPVAFVGAPLHAEPHLRHRLEARVDQAAQPLGGRMRTDEGRGHPLQHQPVADDDRPVRLVDVDVLLRGRHRLGGVSPRCPPEPGRYVATVGPPGHQTRARRRPQRSHEPVGTRLADGQGKGLSGIHALSRDRAGARGPRAR